MRTISTLATDVPDVIINKANFYPGNLSFYFKVIFLTSKNILSPYHNLTHTFHVFWHCYKASIWYQKEMEPREIRNLLIAALFHDFNHSGHVSTDSREIRRAIDGLRIHLRPEDTQDLPLIESLIGATEYPPKKILAPRLAQLIIRDVDLSQALCTTWMQQVIHGLGSELGKSPIEMLKMQEPFLKGIQFATDWAKEEFPQSLIDAKCDQVRRLLDILESQ